MKIQFWSVGKGHEAYVETGILMYTKRIQNYFPLEWRIILPPKNSGLLPAKDLKKKEGELILKSIHPDDFLVILDEKGKQFESEGIAALIQNCGNTSQKNLIFLIGGAFGLDGLVVQRANVSWSLSKLVFPHQLVRLILSEQVYRACTILKNENYHHA